MGTKDDLQVYSLTVTPDHRVKVNGVDPEEENILPEGIAPGDSESILAWALDQVGYFQQSSDLPLAVHIYDGREGGYVTRSGKPPKVVLQPGQAIGIESLRQATGADLSWVTAQAQERWAAESSAGDEAGSSETTGPDGVYSDSAPYVDDTRTLPAATMDDDARGIAPITDESPIQPTSSGPSSPESPEQVLATPLPENPDPEDPGETYVLPDAQDEPLPEKDLPQSDYVADERAYDDVPSPETSPQEFAPAPSSAPVQGGYGPAPQEPSYQDAWGGTQQGYPQQDQSEQWPPVEQSTWTPAPAPREPYVDPQASRPRPVPTRAPEPRHAPPVRLRGDLSTDGLTRTEVEASTPRPVTYERPRPVMEQEEKPVARVEDPQSRKRRRRLTAALIALSLIVVLLGGRQVLESRENSYVATCIDERTMVRQASEEPCSTSEASYYRWWYTPSGSTVPAVDQVVSNDQGTRIKPDAPITEGFKADGGPYRSKG